MTTPLDPYAGATSALPSATQSIIPATGLGLNDATINTSDLNVSSGGGGVVLGYTGSPSVGNLYFSLSPTSGTDTYGNTVVTGLSVNAGNLTGVSLTGIQMDSTSTLQNTQINQGNILAPAIAGGTAVSMIHTMTNSGGQVLGYTSGNSSVTFSTNGNYLWTCPTGITQAYIQCWGAGGGGGGGGVIGGVNQGGESGGGGEYSAEPAFNVLPGTVYSIIVGAGGQGGTTGYSGQDGGRTIFQNVNGGGSAVTGYPGLAGNDNLAGIGGSGSTASINFDGGDGAGVSGNTGGAGGGSSAGNTPGTGVEGADGTESAGSFGGAPGSVTGGGDGGTGGNAGGNGVNGAAPGGGGGGAGYTSVTTGSYTYSPNDNATYSYYGPDAQEGNANKLHDGPNGPLYVGLPINAGQPYDYGHQYSFIPLPYPTIQSQLSGKIVTSVSLYIKCLYSYYSTGVYNQVSYFGKNSFGNTGTTVGSVFIKTYLQQQNTTVSENLGLGASGGLGTALQSGAARAIMLGPGDLTPSGDYYGSFDDGENGGVQPKLIVNYANSAGATAGTGGDGQCIITYNSGTVPTYVLSVSAAQTNDVFGNNFNPGFTGQQLTLTQQTTISTATSINSIGVAANSAASSVTVTTSPGFVGTLPPSQVDISLFTVTSNSFTQISKAYAVPLGDPQLGTTYRLSVFGNLTTGSNVQVWNMALSAWGNTLATFAWGAANFQTSSTYAWCVTGIMQVIEYSAGAGSVRTYLTGTLGQQGVNLGNALYGGALTGIGAITSFPNSASTIQLQTRWNTAETGLTVFSYGSTLERIGP